MISNAYNKPLPPPDPLTKPFWDRAREKHLAVQRCDACGDLHFPASPCCPKCLSPRQGWQDVSGRGTLMSWVEFHRAYWDGFKGDLPYPVGMIQLEEAPIIMMASLVRLTREPVVGEAVEVVFDPVTDEITLPKFQLKSP